jgi:alpha-tubulin suppressor-like RCC1 family protein
VQVACGKEHTACVTVKGAVFSWGRNDMRQLGVVSNDMRQLGVVLDTSSYAAVIVLSSRRRRRQR